MSVHAIRFERVAFLMILVGVGIVLKVVGLIRACHATSKGLASAGLHRRVDAWGGQSRPHSPPAA